MWRGSMRRGQRAFRSDNKENLRNCITAQRYAAAVYAVAVCLSVHHKSETANLKITQSMSYDSWEIFKFSGAEDVGIIPSGAPHADGVA